MAEESSTGTDASGGNGHDAHTQGAVGAPASAEFWEDFYRDSGPWTGNPNAALVAELAERPLRAGTALDLACGTGGDALWLAGQGWVVTGVDISQSALTTAAAAAEAAGVSEHIRWERCDLDAGFPEGVWDLVNIAYLHSPMELSRERILRRAARAVAAGGSLIVIGHQGERPWPAGEDSLHRDSAAHHHGTQHLPSVEEVLAKLDLDGWTVVRSGDVTVTRSTPDGTPSTRVDNIIRLQRDPS